MSSIVMPAVIRSCFVLLLLLLPFAQAVAADEILSSELDLVWVAFCAALVFFMQAGFALLEGGRTRSKNTINVVMKNYCDLSFGVMAFWLVGFGLMFGSSLNGWLGTDHFAPDLTTGRENVFFLYQAMFAATAATIVSGAVAERMRFWPYVLGAITITGFIYPVYGAWVWGSFYSGSGWLAELGFIDFAGSTVVHSVGAWCALAAIIVLGSRLGRFGRDGTVRDIPGHNLALVALGVFIIWLGWFGFNGGSTLEASVDIGRVLVNTQLAGVAGVIGALLAMARGPVYMTGAVNGAIGGLVSITAGAATMSAPFAVLSGLVGGLITVWGARWLQSRRLDDVVDAIAAHGFCGVWGTLAAGLFLAGDMFNPTDRKSVV